MTDQPETIHVTMCVTDRGGKTSTTLDYHLPEAVARALVKAVRDLRSDLRGRRHLTLHAPDPGGAWPAVMTREVDDATAQSLMERVRAAEPGITVAVTGAGGHLDGLYRAIEIEHDMADDRPALRVWLDPDRPKEQTR
jgi:hypothetical protein